MKDKKRLAGIPIVNPCKTRDIRDPLVCKPALFRRRAYMQRPDKEEGREAKRRGYVSMTPRVPLLCPYPRFTWLLAGLAMTHHRDSTVETRRIGKSYPASAICVFFDCICATSGNAAFRIPHTARRTPHAVAAPNYCMVVQLHAACGMPCLGLAFRDNKKKRRRRR
jgi:hypothetical protein